MSKTWYFTVVFDIALFYGLKNDLLVFGDTLVKWNNMLYNLYISHFEF